MQMDGLVAVHEYLDHFEADVDMATLRAAGIVATLEEDARHGLMGHGLLGSGTRGTDPLFRLLVREEDAEEAAALLHRSEDSLPAAFRDGEVAVWRESVAARTHGRRRARRLWVLAWLYGLLALLVVIGAIGFLTSR
jgi:hypothetical protein